MAERRYLTSSAQPPSPVEACRATWSRLAGAITEYKRASRRRAYAMTAEDCRHADDAVDAASDALTRAQADHVQALARLP